MQTFEKQDDQTLRVVTQYTKEELLPVDQIVAQIKGYEDQIAYSNEKIAELKILLDEATSLGITISAGANTIGVIPTPSV